MLFVLKYSGVLRCSRRWTTRKGFLIIGWHGVSLEDEHKYFHTLFISPEQFEQRIKFLKNTFQIASLEECLAQKEAGTIKPGQVVLTFDDGYYNFLQRAVPILDRYDAPAVNYVVSARMLDARSKPNLVLRDCIYRTNCTELVADGIGCERALPLRSSSDRRRAEKQVLKCLDQTPAADKDAFVNRVGEALGIDVGEIRRRRFWTSMTEDEVAELANRNGKFSLQLHSHEHINAVALGDKLSEDLRLCRSAIEKATGRPARDFCFPTGLWSHSTWDALQENGIRSAVTTRRGPNFVETHNYNLRRVMDGGANTQLEFEFEVSGIKWLLHSWLHPKAKYNPSEKLARYRDDKVRY
ncbi:Poly-beta-1,6-N-acetyl-D-glucosamine N-deacetylase precursor [Stieleria maiorica]|uniref:Poly-beta-1,6-N-acetyl-D-glucosamine N-deacetylase n=2 Tax=Stieleria maiorica TaxID=2795974 RepID=A0A5B9ML29_9BACT|nr:Poly-beta-1,6-N-acetyl-D-glucosamine N-deacetylase precursor [Stieleria maiorica]